MGALTVRRLDRDDLAQQYPDDYGRLRRELGFTAFRLAKAPQLG